MLQARVGTRREMETDIDEFVVVLSTCVCVFTFLVFCMCWTGEPKGKGGMVSSICRFASCFTQTIIVTFVSLSLVCDNKKPYTMFVT